MHAVAQLRGVSIVPERPLKNQLVREPLLSAFVARLRGRETTIVSEILLSLSLTLSSALLKNDAAEEGSAWWKSGLNRRLRASEGLASKPWRVVDWNFESIRAISRLYLASPPLINFKVPLTRRPVLAANYANASSRRRLSMTRFVVDLRGEDPWIHRVL